MAGLPVRADLTLRYTTEIKAGSALRAGQQFADIPKERVVRIKGDKTQTTSGRLTIDIANKKTGQTGMVAGFRAEERLMTMAISMPDVSVTSGLVSSGLYSGGSLMRLELHTWVASPEIRAASR